MKREKRTYKVAINWNGEISIFHTTTTSLEKALINSCHKLGKLTHISGTRIYREVNNSNKAHVAEVCSS